jgi:hypothetical protein
VAQQFSDDVIEAVTRHINADHADDGLAIVRAFARSDAESVVMTGLDGDGGDWTDVVAGERTPVRVSWFEPVSERAEIRPAVVALYQKACEILGIPARQPH